MTGDYKFEIWRPFYASETAEGLWLSNYGRWKKQGPFAKIHGPKRMMGYGQESVLTYKAVAEVFCKPRPEVRGLIDCGEAVPVPVLISGDDPRVDNIEIVAVPVGHKTAIGRTLAARYPVAQYDGERFVRMYSDLDDIIKTHLLWDKQTLKLACLRKTDAYGFRWIPLDRAKFGRIVALQYYPELI